VIGIDLVNIDEFRRQLELTGEALVHRAFSEEEVSLCNAENSSPTVDQLATLWAAKEAVVKAALSPPASLKDVVISPDGSGRLSGRIGKFRFDLSISNYGTYVVAVAMAVES
jgi:phosphopantetheine--protein transferase-like protein